MKTERLQWDSDFFQIDVGKLVLKRDITLDLLKENLDKETHFDLLYIFDGHKQLITNKFSSKNFNVSRYDEKLVYCWKTKSNIEEMAFTNGVINYTSLIVTPELEALTYLSGHKSRFLLDSKISKRQFRELYYQWIWNSVNKKICDYLLVKLDKKEKIIAFVTFSINQNNQMGKIGLIAVSPESSGAGLGSILINNIKQLCNRLKLKGFTVATQKSNFGACKFYEKNNCLIESETHIYHAWKKEQI